MTFNQLMAWVMSLDSGFIEIRKDGITKAMIIHIAFNFNGTHWCADYAVTRAEMLMARESVDDMLSARFDMIKQKFDEMVAGTQ